jgi:hypothetical protein
MGVSTRIVSAETSENRFIARATDRSSLFAEILRSRPPVSARGGGGRVVGGV